MQTHNSTVGGSLANNLKRRKRKILRLDIKREIIHRLEGGETAAALSRAYSLNESTIRCIKRSAAGIKNSVAQSNPAAAGLTARVRNPLIEKMETMLGNWVDLQNQNKIKINSTVIRKEALKIYKILQQKDTSFFATEQFLASKGWFDNFRKRQNLSLITLKDNVAMSEYVPKVNEDFKVELDIERKEINISPITVSLPAPDTTQCRTLIVNPTLQAVEIAELSRSIDCKGFNDIQEEDVTDLIKSHNQEMSVEDLIKVTEKRECKEVERDVAPRKLTIKGLRNFLQLADKLAKEAVEMDPNLERSLEFGKGLNGILSIYKKIYAHKHEIKRQCSYRRKNKNKLLKSSMTSVGIICPQSLISSSHPKQEVACPGNINLL